MIPFVDYVSRFLDVRHPCLVLGQGPTFSNHAKFPDLDKEYLTVGLNRVARARKVHITHVIDLHVLDDIPDLPDRTGYLLMPWAPHVNWRPSRTTLGELIQSHPTIRAMDRKSKLLWYNLCTSQLHHPSGSPVVKVTWFSAEAAIHLLALSGFRKIRTLGIDGGKELAPEFSFMKPLKAGHQTYSLQDKEIAKLVAEFGLEYGPLGGR